MLQRSIPLAVLLVVTSSMLVSAEDGFRLRAIQGDTANASPADDRSPSQEPTIDLAEFQESVVPEANTFLAPLGTQTRLALGRMAVVAVSPWQPLRAFSSEDSEPSWFALPGSQTRTANLRQAREARRNERLR